MRHILYDILVCGHLCLDLLPTMDHIPLEALASPGRLFETGALRLSTGGAVSNTGLALHRLGADVRLMAAIGNDFIGGATRQFIAGYSPHLTQHLHGRDGSPGAYTVVLSSQGRDRVFLHCPGTNATFGIEDIDFAVVGQGRIFHLGYPPILPRMYADDGRELTEIYRRAAQTGVATSLDLSLPDESAASGKAAWRTILERTLPYVTIFLPSIDEIVYMLRPADFSRWGRACAEHVSMDYLRSLAIELHAYGTSIVGFKLGDRGMYLSADDLAETPTLAALGIDRTQWSNRTVYQRAFEAEVVGTTGAGDSAYAGLLVGICRGMSIEDAARFSCAVGACNVEAADATSGVRSFDETTARLNSGWSALSVGVKEV